jgi:fumarate reductase subunit D
MRELNPIVIYMILGVVALGVLLLSESGKNLIVFALYGSAIVGIIYLLCTIFMFVFSGASGLYNQFFKTPFPIFMENWVFYSIIFCVIASVIYKALYPLGKDPNRQMWTGKMKSIK